MRFRPQHFSTLVALCLSAAVLILAACESGSDAPTATLSVTATTESESQVATSTPVSSGAVRQPWPEGQPVTQSEWVKDRVDALKSIIGGEVVTLEPQPADVPHGDDSPERFTPGDLAERIAERFGPWPEGGAPAVVDGRVRLEHAEGAQLVAQIASAWPHQVRSFTVGRPTLEDVFLHLTGKQFES